MFYSRAHSKRLRRAPAGFTLIEAALVTCIIGVGVVALLQLLAVGTTTNASGTEMTTGLNLARNIREMTMGMRYCDQTNPTNFGLESGESVANCATLDDLDDLRNAVFSPAIDARRQGQNSFPGWEQRVNVQCVDKDALTVDVPNGSSPAMRITVSVLHHGQEVSSVTWYAFDKED